MSNEKYAEDRVKLTEYRAPGPVGQGFMNSQEFVRFIMGPMGSGKTTLCLFDALIKAAMMPKGKDGNRHFSGVVIRDTYPNLWDTTIRSWHKFFPQEMGKWVGARGRQAEHKLEIRNPIDNSITYFSMRFTALADQSVEDALKGNEYTWAFMSEANLQIEDVLTYLIGRVGRYPGPNIMGPDAEFWYGIVGDLNPPDTDDWVFKRFIEKKEDGDLLEFYRQPGGRDPKAENVSNLPKGYYERLIKANASNEWWIRRNVDGMFGYSRDGMPVYSQYDDVLHASEKPLEADPSLPLRLSFDQGITQPTMVVKQFDPAKQQVRVLAEYAPGRASPTFFARGCKSLIQTQFPGLRLMNHGTVDPAGLQGEIKEEAVFSWAQMVGHELGLALIPAETNELDPRIDVVGQLLTYNPFPGVPALLISSACPILRKGFNSHYRFKRKPGLYNRYSEKPEKNFEANVMEALQYGLMDIFGLQGIIGGAIRDGTGARQSGVHDPYADSREQMQSAVKPGDFDVMGI